MSIESNEDLDGIRLVGKVVAEALQALRETTVPGITTAELDEVCAAILAKRGARPAPKFFYGFPGSTCISVNNEVTHGIPGPRKLREGDLVKLDVTAELNGYVADAAVTVLLPPEDAVKNRICETAETALRHGITAARAGQKLNEIGRAISKEVRRQGFSVLPELSGHGVGRRIHEYPDRVPNFHDRSIGTRLREGMVIAIEPLISAGSGRIVEARDGWTIKTSDGSISAHFEHTVIVMKESALVVTAA
jgi:methionyl aminopeptidase